MTEKSLEFDQCQTASYRRLPPGRLRGYWSTENPRKIQALARAIKDKLQDWEAIRSSASGLVLEWARAERMFEKLEGYYQGEFMDPELDPNSVENQARAANYLALASKILDYKIKVQNQWMAVHGVDPQNPVCQVQVQSITQQIGNPAGELENLPQYEIQAIRLARHLQAHARTFNMPLPKSLQVGEEPEAEKKTIEGVPVKGKVQ